MRRPFPEVMKAMTDSIPKVQEYERKRARAEVCGLSWVQPTNAIVLNGVAHAGVATHICSLSPTHTGLCECACKVSNLVKK